MAKRKQQQKYGQKIPANNSRINKNIIPKVRSSLENVRNIKNTIDIDFNEDLLNDFKKSLDINKSNELIKWLEKFSELGKAMKNKIDESDKLITEFESKELELLEKEENLDKKIILLKKNNINFEDEKNTLKKEKNNFQEKNAELIKREREIESRELDARLNFSKQNEAALDRLKSDIFDLEKEYKIIRENIEKSKIQLTDLQQEKDDKLQNQALDLVSKEKKLERDRLRVSREWKEIEYERNDIHKEIEKSVENERLNLQRAIDSEKKRAGNAFEKLELAQQKIDSYKVLNDKLNGQSIDILLNEYEQFKNENRILKRKLEDSDVSYLESENNALKNNVRLLESRLTEVEPELRRIESELIHQRIGIAEKQGLVEEKKVLEKHKQLLTAHLNELESRIDQLTESQQAQTAFPALSAMDKENNYNIKPHLDEVPDLKTFAPELQRRIAYAEKNVVLNYKLEDIQLLLGGLAMSQLHVFQGISGTGKTSLAKAFAKAMGGYCTDIAVQAGWRDRDDLLGHYNAFEKRFYEKDCLQGLYRAQIESYKDCCNIILLDEMNLSRPEQYFAEFLSALEKNDADERLITLTESGLNNAPKLLVNDRKIKVPANVWFIGTANHDETTNELADKTYDRSHIMILPRHEAEGKLERIDPQRFSFRSLQKQFTKAQRDYRKEVEELLLDLTTSNLSDALEELFDLGWGNRFERQALQFIPVVIASGGTKEEALDHLLATRVFRNGKVTGRYDIGIEDISTIKDELNILWKNWGGKPSKCLSLLEKDERLKGNHA